MDQISDHSDGQTGPVIACAPIRIGSTEKTQDREQATHLTPAPRSKPSSFIGWVSRKADKAGLHDWLMVIFTAVLTTVAMLQGILVYQNSQSSTRQLDKLILAADRMDNAADTFSGSSADISRSMIDAVGKLQDEVLSTREATRSSSKTASVLLENQQKALQVSERPYVLVDIKKIFDFVVGKKVMVNVSAHNYGKSPATHVQFAGLVFYGPSALSSADLFFTIADDPNERSTHLIGEHYIKPGAFLADPEKVEDFSTIQSVLPVTASDVAWIKSHNWGIVAVGRIDYKDLFGNPYHTSFCSYTFSNGMTATCDKHNDVQ